MVGAFYCLEMAARLITGGLEMAARVITGGLDVAARVITGGLDVAARVITGGLEMAARVITGGLDVAARVITGGLDVAAIGPEDQGLAISPATLNISDQDILIRTGIAYIFKTIKTKYILLKYI